MSTTRRVLVVLGGIVLAGLAASAAGYLCFMLLAKQGASGRYLDGSSLAMGMFLLVQVMVFIALVAGLIGIVYRKRPVDRVLVIAFGYTVAAVAAGLTVSVVYIAVATIFGRPGLGLKDAGPVFAIVTTAAVGFTFVLALLPAIAVIVYAELNRVRAPAFYGYAGSAVAASIILLLAVASIELLAALPIFAPAGGCGGLAYWRIAGRSAGQWRPEFSSAAA